MFGLVLSSYTKTSRNAFNGYYTRLQIKKKTHINFSMIKLKSINPDFLNFASTSILIAKLFHVINSFK